MWNAKPILVLLPENLILSGGMLGVTSLVCAYELLH